MTIHRAAMITDLTIAPEGAGRWRVTGHGQDYALENKCEKHAAQEIVMRNWKIVSIQCFESAGWHCEDCQRIKPLTAHHKRFRSHGRLDRPENLAALCLSCHEKRHGR